MSKSGLTKYLQEKALALKVRESSINAAPLAAKRLTARVTAEGRSGIRRVSIRDFQVITDAPPDLAGYNLGPSAPELLLGSLGSCLVHTLMIQAAWLKISIDTAEAVVSGSFDARTGHPAFPNFPSVIKDVTYVLHIGSTESDDQIAGLHDLVSRYCPILNLLRNQQVISGKFMQVLPKEQV